MSKRRRSWRPFLPFVAELTMIHMVMKAGAVLLLLGGALTARAQEWGCYDPKPGHPTTAEKLAFIESMSSLAVAAEKKHGVPAAAIAAMTMVESGYDWTRTAIEGRNYFGWKFYSTAAASGHSSYELCCQPPEDQNNRYIVFTDAADAVDFVAGKLAALPAYRTKTAAYRQARNAGASAEEASRNWIAAIADPYNWKPAEYAQIVIRVIPPGANSDYEIHESRAKRLSDKLYTDAAEAGFASTESNEERKNVAPLVTAAVGGDRALDLYRVKLELAQENEEGD